MVFRVVCRVPKEAYAFSLGKELFKNHRHPLSPLVGFSFWKIAKRVDGGLRLKLLIEESRFSGCALIMMC